MAPRDSSVSSQSPSSRPPATVRLVADEHGFAVGIHVHDAAAFEFADRLAERGVIAPLEQLIADAIAAYVTAPDRLIRNMQRGTKRRVRKPAKPSPNRPAAEPPPAPAEPAPTAEPEPPPRTALPAAPEPPPLAPPGQPDRPPTEPVPRREAAPPDPLDLDHVRAAERDPYEPDWPPSR